MTKIDNYNRVDEFLKFVKEFDVSSNPFLSYAFLSVYLKHFPQGNFYFLNIFEEDKLIGIIPFECTFDSRLLHVKKLRFMGYRQFNYEQYICHDSDMQKIHRLLMDFLERQKRCILLNLYDINDSSPLYQVLQNDTRTKVAIALYSCPCLRLSDDFESFFKTVYQSSKKRTELKKFQKKVSELGDFKIINVEDKNSYDNNIGYIDQIYRVHKERFADVYATSFFGSKKMKPYYSELINSLMCGEKGHISLLVLDEIVIAFIFCLTNGTVLIDWIPAFDPAFAKYSLGIVQYKMLFEDLCNQGKYKVFDYSKGSSVYKRKWAKEETINYQFLLSVGHMNPVSYLFYLSDNYKYRFKVYLREKGVLEFVKKSIGKILLLLNSKPRINNDVTVTILKSAEDTGFVFNYSDLINYSVKVRETILTALYQGKKIVSVGPNEIKLAE